ncbi:uncharacterized protein LOC125523903 [Triticum urartu]|uniref:uncharacterized protein LOC125523903 n=1 Tax=Triticum urartu TaxID=4572 RepID=UPI00204424E9|nr:uncharacterized protein LOC125523903 [Triticum urartu]
MDAIAQPCLHSRDHAPASSMSWELRAPLLEEVAASPTGPGASPSQCWTRRPQFSSDLCRAPFITLPVGPPFFLAVTRSAMDFLSRLPPAHVVASSKSIEGHRATNNQVPMDASTNRCIPFHLCQGREYAKYHDVDAPQVRLHGTAKYPYARRCQDHFGIHKVLLPLTRTSTKKCTSTVAEIARTSTDDLEACTTIIVGDPYLYRFQNMNDYFHYDRPENVYFPFIAPNSTRFENAPLKGISAGTMSWTVCM